MAKLICAAAPVEMDAWQPMDTAPLDGKFVIVWCSGWQDGSEARYIPDHGWYLANIDHTDNHGNPIYPVCWQPLPGAPKAIAAAGEGA